MSVTCERKRLFEKIGTMSRKKPLDARTSAIASTAELEKPVLPITGSETLANLE